MKIERIYTDVLIIGGGAAGIYSGITLLEKSNLNVTIVDKGNIKRSGCLAAGINALNAYINPGQTEEDYLDYVKSEFDGIVREDLVYTIAERLNSTVERLERLGLPILKDENGEYISRGKRSIKVNGENIKPLLERGLYEAAEDNGKNRLNVLNYVNVFDYIKIDNNIVGAIGFSIKEEKLYIISAKATICTTGGASGIYRPNNINNSRHKMWYSPFNTGAGYAMGIRAGAEMTSFEMRFIALRLKDTIAPTGTIAQGTKLEHVNAKGESYIDGKMTTGERLKRTIEQNEIGNGPCYLKTKGINKDIENQLVKAYLNMAPGQVIKWIDEDRMPSEYNVEIEGTEPYIVGGHSAAGYWVGTDRSSSIEGLFVAGDVAGGSPKKYATGSFAEGEIAAESAISFAEQRVEKKLSESKLLKEEESALKRIKQFYMNEKCDEFGIESVEDAMQKIMDEYAGGISANYRYNEERLLEAIDKLKMLESIAENLRAEDTHELLFIMDVIDRLLIANVLINHIVARKETRWLAYQENQNYPDKREEFDNLYINSEYSDGKIKIRFRNVIRKDQYYEHRDNEK